MISPTETGEAVVKLGKSIDRDELGASNASLAPDQPVTGGNELANPKSIKSPAFQFYPKDFLSSTKVQRMSLPEVGAYTLLLSHCWVGGGLPSNPAELAKIVKVKPTQFAKWWAGPLGECFYERGGRMFNERLDDEAKKQATFRKRQKGNADKRWEKSGNAVAMPPQSQPDALLSPISYLQSSTPVKTTTAARGAPIVQRRKLWAAFEGPRALDVPTGVHQKFRERLNREDADTVLFAWYAEVCEAWHTGPHKDDNPGRDLPGFWDARFDEKWPPATKAKKDIPIGQRWRPSNEAVS